MTKSLTIRAARHDELHLLRSLERAAGRIFAGVGLDVVADDEPPSIEELGHYLTLGRLWVAVDETDQPLGYAMVSEVDGEAHLDQVSVHPDHGRQGIGTALVEHACKWARDSGFHAVTITTYRHVPWNGPLYARLGFEVVADADFGPEVAAIRATERAKGLDIQPRVVMRRLSRTNRRSQGFVEYEGVAARYQEGRALPGDVLARWGSAVRPYLPSGSIRVADVGAGTGIFAEAWPLWAPATIVAVEPSAAMARAGHVVDPAVSFVQGVAEHLPLRGASIDVVWVSTAMHHFADFHLAVEEFARVLRGGGRVLLRTYLPGRTEVTWVDAFPGRVKWEARFHTEAELVTLFSAHGFALTEVSDVFEWSESFSASAQWVERMRNADSMLTALSDEEIARGLGALRSEPARVGRLELTLVVFTRG